MQIYSSRYSGTVGPRWQRLHRPKTHRYHLGSDALLVPSPPGPPFPAPLTGRYQPRLRTSPYATPRLLARHRVLAGEPSAAAGPPRRRALLTSSPDGAAGELDADLRDPGKILTQAARTLDFSKPVAVVLIAVLHVIGDDEDPYGCVAGLIDAVPSGSYVALSHVASDIEPEKVADAMGRLSRAGNRQGHAVPAGSRPASAGQDTVGRGPAVSRRGELVLGERPGTRQRSSSPGGQRERFSLSS